VRANGTKSRNVGIIPFFVVKLLEPTVGWLVRQLAS
jgi:hypothetical protein